MGVRSKKRFDLTETRLRSALTNGGISVPGVDGRSSWMRRLTDLRRLHENDLGGSDLVSHSERVLVARSAMIVLQTEMMEASFAHTDGLATTEQLEVLQRCLNSLRRTYECLGLRRRPKEVETLEQYLASKQEERECESSESHPGPPEEDQQQ